MTVRFLGTGTSQGVPVIGCDCAACLSTHPGDTRLRTSFMVEKEDTVITIDCGPDFRAQMLRSGRVHLDGILFTHEHQDHVAGLDDVRPLNFKSGKEMPLWADERTGVSIRNRFGYAFEQRYPGAPRLALRQIKSEDTLAIGQIQVKALSVMHGSLPILGYYLDDRLAYLTDVKTLSEEVINQIKSCEVLIISALRQEAHPTHLTLKEALDYVKRISPKRAYLTHISHTMGPMTVWANDLPDHVHVGQDNLEFTLPSL